MLWRPFFVLLCCNISNLVMEVEFLRHVMGHTSLFLQVFGSRIEAGEKLLQLAVVSGIFILAAPSRTNALLTSRLDNDATLHILMVAEKWPYRCKFLYVF